MNLDALTPKRVTGDISQFSLFPFIYRVNEIDPSFLRLAHTFKFLIEDTIFR